MKLLTALAFTTTVTTIVLCSLPGHAIDPLYDLVRALTRALSLSGGRGGFDHSGLSTDKVAHFAAFAVMSFLWMLRCKSPNAILWVLMGGIMLGALIEVEQGLLIEGRAADSWDLMADTVGTLVGINCVGIYRNWAWMKRQSSS